MARSYYRVKRGMVFWYEPTKSETRTCVQQGRRLWLVVSNDDGNISAPTCNIVPMTTESKTGIPVHVEDVFIYRQNNTILCEQCITVDQNQLRDFVCILTDETMKKVDEALAIQYSISPAVRYMDVNLSNLVEKLEGLIEHIIQEKAKQHTQTVPISQIEDSALRLGQLIEDLVGGDKQLDIGERISKDTTAVSDLSPSQSETSQSEHAPAANNKKQVDDFKSVKKTQTKWTIEKRCEFLRDCDTMSMNDVAEKWGLSVKSSFSTKYNCRNVLEHEGVDYKDGKSIAN